MRIDEHLLAGYISGELSDSDRAAVTAEMIRDSSLREWLHMACAALAAAADERIQGPQMKLMLNTSDARPGVRRGDRQSIPSVNHIRRAM